MTRFSFAAFLLARVPPWLRRTFGAPLVQGLADPFDALADRARESVRARFPTADRPDALAVIGTERRIARGPREPATTYASRMLSWWDDHRGRGGPHALARQFYLFWRSTFNAPFEIVYYSGRRFSVDGTVDASGSPVVTRDDIVWGADGSGLWAQYWIFLRVDGLFAYFVDELGRYIVTDDGSFLVADVLAGGTIDDDTAEDLRVIPREWSAAHIKRATIVVFTGAGRLWDYPVPVPTWDEWETSLAGATWDDLDNTTPAVVTVEF